MLEDDEGHEGNHEDEEEENISEGASPFVQEAVGVVEEDSLETEFVGVEPEHTEDNDCE